MRAAAGGLADGAYYVAIAWINAAGEEGASSIPTMIQVSGQFLRSTDDSAAERQRMDCVLRDGSGGDDATKWDAGARPILGAT